MSTEFNSPAEVEAAQATWRRINRLRWEVPFLFFVPFILVSIVRPDLDWKNLLNLGCLAVMTGLAMRCRAEQLRETKCPRCGQLYFRKGSTYGRVLMRSKQRCLHCECPESTLPPW